MATKLCVRCNTKKTVDCFGKDKRNNDGLASWCKDCYREYRKKWEYEHKKERSKYFADWRTGSQKERQRELVRNRCKDRWRNDPEYRNRKNRQKRERAATDQSFIIRERIRSLFKGRKRRAIKRGLIEHHTKAEWVALCKQYDYRCVCCGKKTDLAADHVVPLSLGGKDTIDNIQPLCKTCNSKKHTKIIDYRK